MWRYNQPVKVIFGAGEIANIADIMAENNLRRGVIISDSYSARTGRAQKLKELAGDLITGIVSQVEPNPTVENVDACKKFASEHNAEMIIGLGGGSAMDCAKAAAAALAMDCTGRELLQGKAITDSLPVIAIPATSGTGSEVGCVAVISNPRTQEKKAVSGRAMFPKIALVDPELTYTMPSAITASTGFDVIAHCLDALTSRKHSPATDALGVKAARMAFENIETAVFDGENKKARICMSEASVTAGLSFSQTGTTGSHGCSYVLTAVYGIPHGEACAFTLDSWFLINAKARPELEELSVMMGFKGVQDVADRINQLKKMFGFRTTLEDVGLKDDGLESAVERSYLTGNTKNNVMDVDRDMIRSVFLSKK